MAASSTVTTKIAPMTNAEWAKSRKAEVRNAPRPGRFGGWLVLLLANMTVVSFLRRTGK
jgi:hypothetical protein